MDCTILLARIKRPLGTNLAWANESDFATSCTRLRFTTVDVLLLPLVTIWISNFSIVKVSLVEIQPFVFNVLRLVIAATVLLFSVTLPGTTVSTRSEQYRLAAPVLAGLLVTRVARATSGSALWVDRSLDQIRRRELSWE